MKERLRKFMEGRYGTDALNRFMIVCGWVLLVAGFMLSWLNSRPAAVISSLLVSMCWALLILSFVRALSKNTSRRASENYRYFVYKNRFLGWFRRLKSRWQDRKVHRYYRCPKCKATVRVPRGKGKIRITCPHCGEQFIKKS